MAYRITERIIATGIKLSVNNHSPLNTPNLMMSVACFIAAFAWSSVVLVKVTMVEHVADGIDVMDKLDMKLFLISTVPRTQPKHTQIVLRLGPFLC